MVKCLRVFSAEQFAKRTPEQFLDYVLLGAQDKRCGVFEDSWDPEEVMLQCGFACLRDDRGLLAESVLAYQREPNGDATLRIAFTIAQRGAGDREERVVCLTDGQASYTKLLTQVQKMHTTPGNFHWGTQLDVQHLCEKLNVGILMFCDYLQLGGTQCLYNIGASRENFPYWIALWWREPVHFRLAELGTEEDGMHEHGRYRCFWRAGDLPPALLQEYQRCNRLAN